MGQPPPRDQVMSTEGQGSGGGPGRPRRGPGPPWVAGDSPARWGQDARVLGSGWIEAAVSTLHCSRLESVFLSPIYTLSVSGCPGRSKRLPFLSSYRGPACLPLLEHFSCLSPLPRSPATSISLTVTLLSVSHLSPSLRHRALDKRLNACLSLLTCKMGLTILPTTGLLGR